MQIVSNIWRGNYPLRKMFWIFLLVPLLFADLVAFGLALFIPDETLSLRIIGFVYPVICLYNFITLRGTWKSASNYTGRKMWKALAYCAVVLGALVLIKRSVTGAVVFQNAVMGFLS